MRSRNRRKSRSNFTLDIGKLYAEGFGSGVVQTIELPMVNERDFELEFCQQILRLAPNHPEALAMLGEAYTKRGEYEKGLETDLRLSQISPENEIVQYNLACSYALTGNKADALAALERAVELGYRDLDHLKGDRDLEMLRGEPRFTRLLERLDLELRETA